MLSLNWTFIWINCHSKFHSWRDKEVLFGGHGTDGVLFVLGYSLGQKNREGYDFS